MDLLEKWIQDNHLQVPDNIDALLEAADLTRQLVQDRNYEGISKMISYTIDHDYYECFTWILDLLQEEFEKTREFDLEDFSCGIGRSIANYDEFADRLQVDHNAQENEVEKVYDEHGEAESFFNKFTYRTGYRNIFLVTAENFDTKDNDYIEYRLLFRR